MGRIGVAPFGGGDEQGMFQGSHGSASNIAGDGLANPIAYILSGASMLDWLGQGNQDERLTAAVLAEGRDVAPDVGGNRSTNSCAEAICRKLG